MYRLILLLSFICLLNAAKAQQFMLKGSVRIMAGDPKATVFLVEQKKLISTDSAGNFSFLGLKPATYQLKVSLLGYRTQNLKVNLVNDTTLVQILLDPLDEKLNEVVITGTQKEVNRLESPVPVEIYTAKFFKKNPTPSIFEYLQYWRYPY